MDCPETLQAVFAVLIADQTVVHSARAWKHRGCTGSPAQHDNLNEY